jgi:hypothetical protein
MPETCSREILPEALANQRLVLYQDGLFIGFDADVLERAVDQSNCRVLNGLTDLKDTSSNVRRVFIASGCDPKFLRSMFIANAVERDSLIRGERLPHKMTDIVFPTTAPSYSEDEVRQNLLADPDTEIVCVNTAWPGRAVGNWLKRSVDVDRPVNIGILGLGRIGFEAAKSLLLSSYLMRDGGLGFDIGSLNVFDGRRSKEAYFMELRHIADPSLREINQCSRVEEVLQHSDIVLFIASDAVPPLSIVDEGQGDVRLLQFDYNHNTLKEVVEAAKKVDFSGQLIVVSDPPEHLSTAVNSAAMHRVSVEGNPDETIGNHQLPALAGRLNWARALHIIRNTRDDNLVRRFLMEGAVFGAHGPGALVADSVHTYDRDVSRELSHELGRINYAVRKAGKLPYDAPGVNLAINVLEMLNGEKVPISLNFGGTTVGVYGRFDRRLGCHEAVPFFDADRRLVEDVVESLYSIRSATEIVIGNRDVETRVPMRTSAFWANKVITHQAVPTRFFPTCSGRSIASFRAIVVEPYHLAREQGDVFLPVDKEIRDMVEGVMSYFGACFEIKSAENSAVADDAIKAVDDRISDVVSEPNEFAEKAAIISIGRVGDVKNFNLDGYKSRYPLYLEIEVDVSTSSNIALIEKLAASGGICLGFTPQIFDKKTLKRRSARLHFGFIGDNVRIEEKPEVPLISSISGHEHAIRVFRNWKACFVKIIQSVGKDNCGKSHRESRIEAGRRKIEEAPGLKLNEVLVGEAYYGESSVLFEHILNVHETAEDLLRILNIDEVDKELLGRLCMLHDIGKAVYLNLSHYVCAYRLQRDNEYDGAICPVPESDFEHDAWRYGVYCDDLREGKLVQLPSHLERFRKFIDLEAGTVVRDTVIARELAEVSIVLKDAGVLKEKLMTFMDSDVELGTDIYILLTELADNLSDYGRMDDIEDIIKYLDLKERYALHRYGDTEEVQESIRRKFSKLRMFVSQFDKK